MNDTGLIQRLWSGLQSRAVGVDRYTILSIVLVVLVVAGASVVVAAGIAPVAAQSNETDNATDDEPGNRVDSAVPDSSGSGSGSSGDTETNATGNTTGNETGNESGNTTGNETASTGETDSRGSEQGTDNDLFSITLDPVQIVADLFHSYFNFWLDLAQGMMEFLTDREYPTEGGEFTLGDELDSGLMQVLNDWWWAFGLPIALIIWLLCYMFLLIIETLFPAGQIYTQAHTARKEAQPKFFAIIFSWMIAAFIIFVAAGLIDFLIPTGQQIAPNEAAMQGQAAGAGWGLIIVWMFGGFLLMCLAFTFFIAWFFLYVMMPALPICMACSVPKVWLFNDFANSFEDLLELYPTFAFFPLPTAFVFSLGYPVLNELQGYIPGPAQWGAVPVYGIGVVIIWFLALALPTYIFFIKKARPLTMLTTGALGAGALSSLTSKFASGSSAAAGAGAGAAANTGAEAAASGHALGSGSGSSPSALGSGNASSGSGGATPSGALSSGTSAPDTTGGGSGAAGGAGTASGALPGGVGASMAENPSTASAASGSPSSSSASGVASASSGTDASIDAAMPGGIPAQDADVTTIPSDGELPDQEYRVGYFTERNGENTFQPVVPNSRPVSNFIDTRAYDRVDQIRDEELFVRGEEDGSFYDASNVAGSDGYNPGLSEQEQVAESRSTVENARGV